VALVTIDIGANDVDGCASQTGGALATCVQTGEANIKKNLPVILRGLRKAAGAGVRFAGMTLYDPVLAGYLSSDAGTKALSEASVPIIKSINGDLTSADTGAGFRTADVANAFKTYDQTDRTAFQGQLVPENVAEVCTLTWACTPKPQGPNIHAKKGGYAVITAALNTVIGRLK